MITGFNTDIQYEGLTYHVQTEDKGLATPLILTLVYDRGTILASKRSPYDDLLIGDFDEELLTDRLKKQHKLMCGAIRAGRIEDLKRMTMKESESRKKGLVTQKAVKPVVEKTDAPEEVFIEQAPMPAILEGKPPTFEPPRSEQITFGETVLDIPLMIVEESPDEMIEEELILPAEAVEIINDLAKSEPADNKLRLELIEEVALHGGNRTSLNVRARRGQNAGLSGAQILVKVIGSSFRPMIFHAKTDHSGVATIHLQIPHFRIGRAAVLIKVMSEGEEIEMRRVIRQG